MRRSRERHGHGYGYGYGYGTENGTATGAARLRVPMRLGLGYGTGYGSEAGLYLDLHDMPVVYDDGEAAGRVVAIVVGELGAHLVAPHPIIDDAADLQRRSRLVAVEPQPLTAEAVRLRPTGARAELQAAPHHVRELAV